MAKPKQEPAKLLLVDRVEARLRERVARMQAAGERALPQEQELAVAEGASVKTIRAALIRLKGEGLVRSVRGKGSFLTTPADRRRLVLVLCRELQHPYTAMAVETILATLRERGLPHVLSVLGNGDIDWAHASFKPEDIAKVMIVGGDPRAVWEPLARRLKVPTVVLTDFEEPVRLEPFCPQVIPDVGAAVLRATRHLLAAGHRRILFAGWLGQAWGRDIVRGYREALESAGLPFDDKLVLQLPEAHLSLSVGHLVEPLGPEQARIDRLLAGPDAPTALIHNSGFEAQAREMLRVHFGNRFDADAIIAVIAAELLTTGYKGRDEAWAVAMPFRALVDHALELLGRSGAGAPSPTRLLVDDYQLFRRTGGVWKVRIGKQG